MKFVVLMGGENLDLKGERYPLYLTEFNEEIILERQLKGFQKLEPSSIVFCVRRTDIREFSMDDVIMQSADNAICVEVAGPTAGSVCTALLSAEYIDGDEEVVFVAADELIDADLANIINSLRQKDCDAGVLAFQSVHPRYSFAQLGPDNMVREIAEKRPVSRNALASFYYFRHGRDFVTCAQSVIRKDRKINNAFYLSQTINEMILRHKRVGIEFVGNEQFHPLKTEMQLAQYISLLHDQREAWLH